MDGNIMDYVWNPWHGCKKISEGCRHCYMYRRDLAVGKDPTQVVKTASFHKPLQMRKDGSYAMMGGANVYTCMTSDFFLPEADPWRDEVWEIIRSRPDLFFLIITKRIVEAVDRLPEDWGEGYPNVMLGCTIENQAACDYRMPVFCRFPAKRKFVVCEPLLEEIDFGRLLDTSLEYVSVGGESGPEARICDFDWVKGIRRQCLQAYVPFHFKQTGARFCKDGKEYSIPRKLQHEQAKKANLDT